MSKIAYKKKFGQNFLTDKNLLGAIADDAEVCKDDNVLEIGAGAGALTAVLAERAKKVVSYEIDSDLMDMLHSLNLDNVTFINKDALKEPTSVLESHFSGEYKLVANLPYYITTPLLFKFLEEARCLTSLTIMVQKEVAERMCAKAGSKDYGVLSVMVAYAGKAKITRYVSRKMFTPQPNVDSAVVNIKISPRKDVDRDRLFFIVRKAFSMRRKTIANNLAGLGFSREELEQKLSPLDLTRRAETVTVEEFIFIASKL